MHIAKCQKHKTSVHVIIPRTIRHALRVEIGTTLVFTHKSEGVVEIRNVDDIIAKQMTAAL